MALTSLTWMPTNVLTHNCFKSVTACLGQEIAGTLTACLFLRLSERPLCSVLNEKKKRSQIVRDEIQFSGSRVLMLWTLGWVRMTSNGTKSYCECHWRRFTPPALCSSPTLLFYRSSCYQLWYQNRKLPGSGDSFWNDITSTGPSVNTF